MAFYLVPPDVTDSLALAAWLELFEPLEPVFRLTARQVEFVKYVLRRERLIQRVRYNGQWVPSTTMKEVDIFKLSGTHIEMKYKLEPSDPITVFCEP